MIRRPKILTLFLAFALLVTAAAEPAFVPVPDWPKLPPGTDFGSCAGIGVDSENHVWVFHRNGRPWSFPVDPIAGPTVTEIDGATGRVMTQWGADKFILPHGLSLDRENHLWLTDVARQQVFEYTREGRQLLVLGERGVGGADHTHFNLPTDVAVLPDGSFYVADGYRNSRVVKFDATGNYLFEWGAKGKAPGEFSLPHGIVLDSRGRVLVCDRSNSRVQVFDPAGHFLAEWKGPEIGRPFGISLAQDGHIFTVDGGDQLKNQPNRAKFTELDTDGRFLSTTGSWGSAPGEFKLGHDIAAGPDGAIYLAESEGHRVQKFIRAR